MLFFLPGTCGFIASVFQHDIMHVMHIYDPFYNVLNFIMSHLQTLKCPPETPFSSQLMELNICLMSQLAKLIKCQQQLSFQSPNSAVLPTAKKWETCFWFSLVWNQRPIVSEMTMNVMWWICHRYHCKLYMCRARMENLTAAIIKGGRTKQAFNTYMNVQSKAVILCVFSYFIFWLGTWKEKYICTVYREQCQ